MKKYDKAHGLKPGTEAGQIKWMNSFLLDGSLLPVKIELNADPTPQAAAKDFCSKVERPYNGGDLPLREADAEQVYEILG